MTNEYIADYDQATRLASARSAQVNVFPDMVVAAFDLLPDPAALQTNLVGYCEATGADGAYAGTVSPWPDALAEGQSVRIRVNHTNPGGSVETFALNGFAAKPIRDNLGQALLAGMMVADTIVWLSYVAGHWQLDNIATPIAGLPDVDVIRRTSAVVRPEDFTGTTEETLELAFAAGLSTGLPVRLDGVYPIATAIPTVSYTTGRLRVEGSGRIVVTANIGVAVSFHAPYSSPVSVSAVEEVEYIFPGTDPGTSDATKITAAGHGCAIGDLVKIVSDDILVPVSLAATRRRGEFAYVGDVDGNDVYVGGHLTETYSTNVRIVRVSTGARFVWDGPAFDTSGGGASWNLFCLRVRGFYRPRVQAAFDHGFAVGLDLTSCYMADVEVDGLKFLNRVASGSSSGYLVQDQSSFMSQIRISATDHRHAYTTTTPTTSTGAEPYLYGRTIGSVVRGVAASSSAASFDTHTEADGITFDACQSATGRYEESSPGAGFQLRGTRNRAVNCSDRSSQTGLLFYAQEPDGDCTDCEAIGFNYLGSGYAIRINNSSAEENATRPIVRGGKLATSNRYIITAERCVGAIIEDVIFTPTGAEEATHAIQLNGDADVLVRRVTFDLSRYTGTVFRPFAFNTGTTGNRLVVEGAKIINGAGKFQSWFSGSGTTGHLTLKGLEADSIPSSGVIVNFESLDSFDLADGWSTIEVWDQAIDGSAATVDFLNINFDEAMVICRGVTKSVSGTLDLRVSTNNGVSWKFADGEYVLIDAAGTETTLASVRIHDTAATAARSGAITVSGLQDIAKKMVHAHNRAAFATVEGTSPISGLRVLPSGGGNLTGGTITLLGRR
jgi:hypothetical protein